MGLSAHLLRCHSKPKFKKTLAFLVYGYILCKYQEAKMKDWLLDYIWPDYVALINRPTHEVNESKSTERNNIAKAYS